MDNGHEPVRHYPPTFNDTGVSIAALHHPTALLGSTLKCLRVLYHRYLITSCLIWQSFRLIYCKVVLIADVTVALIGTDLELIGNPFFQLGHVTDDPDHARIAFQSLQRLQCIIQRGLI